VFGATKATPANAAALFASDEAAYAQNEMLSSLVGDIAAVHAERRAQSRSGSKRSGGGVGGKKGASRPSSPAKSRSKAQHGKDGANGDKAASTTSSSSSSSSSSLSSSAAQKKRRGASASMSCYDGVVSIDDAVRLDRERRMLRLTQDLLTLDGSIADERLCVKPLLETVPPAPMAFLPPRAAALRRQHM
jgi:hypothetical protein